MSPRLVPQESWMDLIMLIFLMENITSVKLKQQLNLIGAKFDKYQELTSLKMLINTLIYVCDGPNYEK